MSSSTSASDHRASPWRELARLAGRGGGFLLGLAVLYLPVYRLSLSPWFDGRYITVQNLKLAEMRSGTGYDVVILGDSTAMTVNPVHPVTRAMLPGRSVYNYALANIGGVYPIASAFEKVVAGAPAPRLVLLAFLPSMLTGRSDILAGEPLTKFYAARFYDFEEIFHDPELRRHRRAQALLLAEKLRIRFSYQAYDMPRDEEILRRVRENRGQFLIWEQTRATTEDVERAELYRGDFRPAAQAVGFLEGLLERAERHGTRVLLFAMPDPDTVYERRVENGYYRDYFDLLAQISARHPNLTVVDQAFSLPDEMFAFDVTHLNRAGVGRFHREQWPGILETAARLVSLEGADLRPRAGAAGGPPRPGAVGGG